MLSKPSLIRLSKVITIFFALVCMPLDRWWK